MPQFSLLVKPCSADCNLACEYCFYRGKKNLYPDTPFHRMSDVVLERLIKTYMQTAQSVYSICWQGGEPTLMGTDFFSRVVELEKKYGYPRARISNSIQTNATLITDEMAAFFTACHFLVGCSLDGPETIHNRYRCRSNGKATHQDAIKGIDTLNRNNTQFNILTLVSQANVAHAQTVYRYLKNKGFLYHQYIPCVEFDENHHLLPFAITGEQWGDFLCAVFDEWYPDDIYAVSIRNFESILLKKMDGTNPVCHMGENCCQYFVVEYNGDVYPCDFFVEKPLRLGNIMDNSWEEMMHSSVYQQFGARKKEWNVRCTKCRHLELCAGDCPKNRLYNKNPSEHPSVLCQGHTRFFDHTQKKFDLLCRKIQKKRQKLQNHIDKPPGFGRNNPCPCGSGMKYKKCCGK